MVTGYIPPGEDKKRAFTSADSTFGTTHICLRSVLMVYFVAVSRFVRPGGFLSVVTPRLMEDTMEHSIPMQKFGRVVSSGQTCMETPKNSSGVAQDVKNTGISIPEMLCP